jgi:hypothetical protein
MFDDQDPELARIFAQAREPLADNEFTAKLLGKIDRARRVRLWGQILVIAVIVGVVGVNVRSVLQQTADAVRYIGELSPGSADVLISPWGWAVSMLIGAWVVLRTRPSRR